MRGKRIIVVGVATLVLFGLCEPARSVEGMVSYWRFEEGTGPTAHDLVGVNDGTLMGGASFTAGIVGGAVSVDRADYVDVPDAPNLNFDPTSPMTVELWAYKTSTALVQHILGKREICIASRINYQMADVDPESPYPFSHGLHFNNRAVDDSVSEVTTGVTLSLDTWTHLAATFDGSTLRFYIDGALAGSAAGTLGATTTGPFRMGTSGTCSAGFGGLIDEVAIYDRALTIEEIQRHYVNGLNGFGYLAVEVAIEIKPETLNLQSKGAFTAFIELPEGYGREDVDISTVECEEAPAVKAMMADDSRLIVKFDRKALMGVSPGDAVEMTVTGKFTDEISFVGSDTLKITDRGGKK
jgi:hypothetical protein